MSAMRALQTWWSIEVADGVAVVVGPLLLRTHPEVCCNLDSAKP
jgi:hypothetical protein